MTDAPEKIINLWVEYVNKLDVDNVINLYDENSILLPTFSPFSISKPYQIKEYFKQLSIKQNIRVDMDPGTLIKAKIGETIYIMTGLYSFHFIVDDANLTFPSRFTIILDTSREKPILHHHSSQTPSTPS